MVNPKTKAQNRPLMAKMARIFSSGTFATAIIVFCCFLAATSSSKRRETPSIVRIRKLTPAATPSMQQPAAVDLEGSESVYFPQLVDENELVVTYGNKFSGDYTPGRSKLSLKANKKEKARNGRKQASSSSSSVLTTTENNAYLKYLTETYYSTRPERTTPTSVKSEIREAAPTRSNAEDEALSAQADTSVEKQTVFSLPQARKVPNVYQNQRLKDSSVGNKKRPTTVAGAPSRQDNNGAAFGSKITSLASIPYVEPVIYDFGESNSVVLASSSSSEEDLLVKNGEENKVQEEQQQSTYSKKGREQQQLSANRRPASYQQQQRPTAESPRTQQVFQLKNDYQQEATEKPIYTRNRQESRQNVHKLLGLNSSKNDSISLRPEHFTSNPRYQVKKKLVGRRPFTPAPATAVRQKQATPVVRQQPAVVSVPPSVVEALKNVYSGEQSESAEIRRVVPGVAATVRGAVVGPPRSLPAQKGLITEGFFNEDDPILGEPGKDYPVYHEVPKTSFQCTNQRYPGFYADIDAECQAFHICQLDGRADDFLCPNGTVFNQQYFICDWWYNVECDQSESFFALNAVLYDENAYFGQLPN